MTQPGRPTIRSRGRVLPVAAGFILTKFILTQGGRLTYASAMIHGFPPPPRALRRLLPVVLAILGHILAGGGFPGRLSAQTAEPQAPATPAGRHPGSEAELTPREGVVVMRRGQVVEGKISRSGDHYYIVLPHGEIRLRVADVDFVCRDLEEAYHKKRAVLPAGDVHRHLELARWCQHNGLLGHAAEELLDAAKADPTHPMIGVMQRRLQMALEASRNPPSERPVPQRAGPSRDDLDRFTRHLPPNAVAEFTESVQPLLLNNCLGSGCHGAQAAGGFQLMRVPRGRPPGRRLTQQNLHSAMQWIDRDNPSNSKLLTVPTEPHGTAKTAIFTHANDPSLRALAGWIGSLARRKPATVTDFGSPANRLQPDVQTERREAGISPPTAAGSPPSENSGTTPAAKMLRNRPDFPRGIPPGQSSPDVKRGAWDQQFPSSDPSLDTPEQIQAKDSRPLDPFDPDAFNRRYHEEDG